MIKDKGGKPIPSGSRVKLTLFYEGSVHTIYNEYEGVITDESTFVADNGRIVREDTFDNYDVVSTEILQ